MCLDMWLISFEKMNLRAADHCLHRNVLVSSVLLSIWAFMLLAVGEFLCDMRRRMSATSVISNSSSIADGGCLHSLIKQGLDILESFPGSVLGNIKASEHLDQLRQRVPVQIRHDSELSMSCIFFSLFEDINREFALTGGNLEIVIEMLISSLAWLLGQHNDTFKWFFQVLHVKMRVCACVVHPHCGCFSRRRACRSSREMVTFA